MGRRGPVPVPARRWWPDPPTPPRCPPCCRLCDDARVPVTPAGGAAASAAPRSPCSAGWPSTCAASPGIADVDDTSLVADLRPAPSVPTSSPGCATATGSPSATGPSRWTCPRWAAGWPAAGPASTPTATARSRTWCSASRSSWPTAGWSAPAGAAPRSATGPDLTQLFVGSEGTLGVITEGRFRVHPVPEGEGRRAFGFASFADGLDACRRILRRGATPAVLRLYDATESGRSFDQPDTNVLVVLDEADPALVDATLAVVDPSAPAPPRSTSTSSTAGSPTATTSRPWPRCGAPGWWSTPSRSSGRWAALPGLYDAVLGGPRRGAGHAGRLLPPEPRLHRRRLPLLHLRRPTARGAAPRTPPPRRLGGRLLPPGVGRGHPGHHGRRRRLSHHHGIGHQPGPLPRRRPRRVVRRAGVGEGRPRPPRHPQSRQARTAQPVRPGALAMSILVVDVGTSGVRGADRAPRRLRRAHPPRPGPARHPVPRDWSSSTATAIATAVARGGRPQPGRRRPGRRPWGSPTSGPPPWCGTGRPASRWPRASAGRTCAPSAPASSSRPRASGSPPTPRPPSWPPSSTSPTPTGPVRAGRAGLRHHRHLGGLDPVRRARCTSPTPPTPASRA